MEKLKVWIWRLLNYNKIHKPYAASSEERESLVIMKSIDTIDHILENNISISRFGDGEFQMMHHYLNNGDEKTFNVDSFQQYNQKLAMRLIDVFKSDTANHLVCIPYALKDSRVSRLGTRLFWEREWNFRKQFLQKLNLNRVFGDTNFTRFYLDRLDILNYPEYISKLKEIWDNRNILIIEGEYSRLGVNNDLFSNANSIQRVLCPAINAFEKYDEILSSMKNQSKDKLVLIALGHTATVLAYDICLLGNQALDIGHIDVEYEWYKIKAKSKVRIPNKYVNEVKEGRMTEDIEDQLYKSQIIKVIN
ncbi:SP_1767 family glycosyltransferase [Sphingobacterium bovistauri]|uniref:SP_1767 family glycosyltransferase n=1 Tax=Sphingobacterium bovistauri TaxID=2781959 RepID=A0ABS7Z579_9SPHI|nr:SP_1767 family glycosyltransferase [Sphingobacterium bovistauri]MCA5004119.1 SP_1767 family glycosyltransferase [Sphingobacterium bovistauri]